MKHLKRNNINVSISRAKDYLFIVMPDDSTENVHNLRLVKRVEQLVKSSGAYKEMLTPDLEDQIFGCSTYLEDNSFSTGHQSVNVYGLPEKRYEIRSEDTAVDVQIHRTVNTNVTTSATIEVLPEAIAAPAEATPIITNSANLVFSQKYGEGEIIKRATNGGKSFITVKFESETISYDEAIAYKTKSLIKR